MNAASNPCRQASYIKSKNPNAKPSFDLDPLSNCQSSSLSETDANMKLVEENIIPSLDEIYYCLKNKLLTEKDHILVKMVLDYNEAKWQQMTEDQNKQLATCCLKFYKRLSDSETGCLLEKMREISQKIQMRNALASQLLSQNQSSSVHHSKHDQFEQMFQLKRVEHRDSDSLLKTWLPTELKTQTAFL